MKAVLHPTVRDLEWATGFLEGEGYFGRTKSGEEMKAVQANPEPLHRLFAMFGGRLSGRDKKNYKPNWRPTAVWRVNGGRARGVMMTLYALLSRVRQLQIREALGYGP
jgi:hypothetical protein